MSSSRPVFAGSRPGHSAWPLLAAMLLTGCATSGRFSVDAVRRPDVAGTPHLSYRLVASPALDAGALSALATARVLRDARTALSSKGLYEAPDGVAPALEVEIDFGMERPVQRERTYTEPVYVIAPSAPRASGRGGADDHGSRSLPRKIGDRTVTTIATLHPKFLRVTARAARSSTSEPPAPALWSVVVTNEDESDDIGRYVRLMLAAAMDHIDTQSPAGATVVLSYADGRVRFIEQGI